MLLITLPSFNTRHADYRVARVLIDVNQTNHRFRHDAGIEHSANSVGSGECDMVVAMYSFLSWPCHSLALPRILPAIPTLSPRRVSHFETPSGQSYVPWSTSKAGSMNSHDASPYSFALRGPGLAPPHVPRPMPWGPLCALGYSISLTSLSAPSIPPLAPPSRRPHYTDDQRRSCVLIGTA